MKVCEGQIKSKDKALKEHEARLNDCNRQIEEMSDTILKLKEQEAKKDQVIKKLVESGNKSEKNLQKAEDLLKKANLDNKNLNSVRFRGRKVLGKDASDNLKIFYISKW